MLSIGGFFSALGWIVLLHSTLEVIKYREYVKIIQDEFSDEFSALPLHLTIEVAVGALLATAGAFILSGSLRSISMSRQATTDIDSGNYRMDFVSFHKSTRLTPPIHIAPLK